MINLSDENKALCFADSTAKPLYLLMYRYEQNDEWIMAYPNYITTIKDAVILESFQLDEGVLDSNNFELGSCFVPSIKVQWSNDNIKYKDYFCTVVQQIGNQYIAYFDGYVAKEQISDDGTVVSAEIFSHLHNYSYDNISSAIGNYASQSFAAMVYGVLGVAGIWVKDRQNNVLEKSFPNANIIIPQDTLVVPKKMTALEFLKQAGEFLGAHIRLSEKRVVNSLEELQRDDVFSSLATVEFIKLANVNSAYERSVIGLPNEYLSIPYIQTNGSDGIETNILPDDTTKIRVKVSMDEYTGDAIVGYRASEADAFRVINAYGRTYLDYGSGEGYNRLIGDDTYLGRFLNYVPYNIEVGNRYVFDLDTHQYKVFGDKVTFSAKTNPLFIMPHTKGKLYYCEVYKANNLVFDGLPCVRKSDGIAGLYDTVSGTFLTNPAQSITYPQPIYSYKIPYYIKLRADTTNVINYQTVVVKTETGNQTFFESPLKNPSARGLVKSYIIENNIFFDALSASNDETTQNAVNEVGTYVTDQNFYYCNLETVYAPFLEPSDYLIIDAKNQGLLADGYVLAEYVDLGDTAIDTKLYPNIETADINIDFELTGADTVLFESDGRLGLPNTNQIFLSKNADGTLFNGGRGWQSGYFIMAGTGVPTANAQYEITGFIPIKATDTFRIKNYAFSSPATSYDNISFYDANYEFIGAFTNSSTANPLSQFVQSDGTIEACIATATTNFSETKKNGIAYMRFSFTFIDDTTIATINENFEAYPTNTAMVYADAVESQPGKNKFDYSVLENAGKIEINDANSGEFTFLNTSGMPQTPIVSLPNAQYRVSGYAKGVKSQTMQIAVFYTDGTAKSIGTSIVAGEWVKISGLTEANKTVDYITFGGSGGLGVGTSIKNLQFELGTTETEYEPYKETTGYNLVGQFGYYGGSIQDNIFEVFPIYSNQRQSLNIEIYNDQVTYSGLAEGTKTIWSGNIGATEMPLLIGGNYRLYRFSYKENGIEKLDLYPCIRIADNQKGLYDVKSHIFYSGGGTREILTAPIANTVFPILVSHSKGIHSMRGQFSCEATSI